MLYLIDKWRWNVYLFILPFS